MCESAIHTSQHLTNFTKNFTKIYLYMFYLLVSVLSLTMMIGTFLSGFVIENIGCLWTLRLGMICEVIGWVSIICGQISFTPVFVGRMLSGFGCGLSLPAAYMLLTDVSLVRFRGICAVLDSISYNVGFLIVLMVGAW